MSKFPTTGSESPRIRGDEEEPGACVSRYSLAEGEAVGARGRPVDKVVGRGRRDSFCANVSECHRDVGRWRRPEKRHLRWAAERGGSGEDTVVEVEQSGLGGPYDATLHLHSDCAGAFSKQANLLHRIVEHQAGS